MIEEDFPPQRVNVPTREENILDRYFFVSVDLKINTDLKQTDISVDKLVVNVTSLEY